MLDLEWVSGPEADVLSLNEAKAQLRVTSADENATIQAYINSARSYLEGPGGVLGRVLAAQTWRLHLDCFRPRIQLPFPPLISVDEITYVDPAGAETTLPTSKYRVLAGERAEVEVAYGESFPSVRSQSRAVTITFTCGWAAPEGEDPWPPKVETARDIIRLIVSDRFDNRGGEDAEYRVGESRSAKAIKDLVRLIKIPRT